MPSGKWGSPVNLGDSINTVMEERCPFLHADNQTLYFSSNGHPSFGGHDFFFSRRLPTGRWDVPQNLGSPINTTGEEASLVISLDGKTAYFASERTENGAALDPNLMDTDLYAFELYEGARPRPVTYVRATVYDAETRMPLVALAEVINLATTRRTTSDTTDAFGVFLICLPIGQDFALNVRKTGYLFHSENFKLSEGNTRDKPYLLDIYLMPIREADTTGTATGVPPAAKPVVLRNVFFDTGSATLRPESNIELDILKNLLVENPSLRIRLNGHTDNVGSDSDNLNLSSNRAKAVYDYLVTAGIAASRLNYKGFGETMPIDTNDTPEGRQNNRRTEFEVL
jgi:outer membrane protein OmpA-like peptidoglycan-associated protein